MPNNEPNLTALSDTDLLDQLLAAEADAEAASLAAKKIKNEILIRKTAEIKAQLSAKPEPFGIVNVPFAGKIIKVDTPKKVEWNQDRLESIYSQIQADGANPKEYIKIKYDVSETLWKAWGDNLKSYFKDARTVTPGNPSVKIAKAKE